MANDKLMEMPKNDLAKLAADAKARASNVAARARSSSAHVGRSLTRKAGTVESVVESTLVARYVEPTHPTAAKVIHGASAGIKLVLGIGADYYGMEGAAGACDASATGNLAVLSHQWGGNMAKKAKENAAKKEGEVRGGAPSASTAPSATTQAEPKATGELWGENRLNTSGAGAGYGYDIQQTSGAPSRGRPLLELARRRPLANAIRAVMRTNGWDDTEANVGAVLETVDGIYQSEVDVNPSTGELLETGAIPGLGLLTLLRSLAASSQQLTNLESTAPTPKTGALDDRELAAATVLGVLDPDDVSHVATSGLDDGQYVSLNGSTMLADDVRAATAAGLEDIASGAFGDGFRAWKDRVKYRQQARQKRKAERIAQDKKRVILSQQAKDLKQQRTQEAKTAKLERRVQTEQNSLAQQQQSDAALMAEVQPTATATATATATDNADTSEAKSDDWSTWNA